MSMNSLNNFEAFKLSCWLEEQLQVAARVEILDEENDFDRSLLDQTDRFALFRHVNGNSRDKLEGDGISSAQQHGRKDYYFGGVDVSFANSYNQQDNLAVAVYVIMEHTVVSNSGVNSIQSIRIMNFLR